MRGGAPGKREDVKTRGCEELRMPACKNEDT